jgi:hypothetical protein
LWGKNRGLQDRAAAFIDQSQPTHALAIGQEHLVGGVHLPDLMRPTRALVGGGGPSARQGARHGGTTKPALQGALTRRGSVFIAQEDADQACSPGGMFLTHLQCLLPHCIGNAPGTTTLVVGRQRLFTAFDEALHEMTHRAFRQAKRLGDGGRGLPFSPTPIERAPYRYRNGSGHG